METTIKTYVEKSERKPNENTEDNNKTANKINTCPICKSNGNTGALCKYHAMMLHKFDWVRNYINSLDTVDKNTVYILEFAIGERKSMIINDVDIVNGKMQIEEYLQKKSCTVYMEKMLKEIVTLEKARGKVLSILNNVRQET